MCWQGRLRFLARGYDRALVVCRPGHEALYQDFATVLSYPHSLPLETNMHTCGGDFVYRESVEPLLGYHDGRIPPCSRIAKFLWGRPLARQPASFRQQLFLPLGSPRRDFPLLLHARQAYHVNTARRNWPLAEWERLLERLPSLPRASIGQPAQALHLPGTIDLRGLPLSELCDYLAGARCLVSPSSGPVPLAALCRCPHVTWFGLGKKASDAVRYRETWNPFATPCEVLYDRHWRPPLEWVVEQTLHFLRKGA